MEHSYIMHRFGLLVAGNGMLSNRRKWSYGIGAGVLVLGILLWNPLSRAVFSARLAWSLQQLASGDSGQDLEIRETRVHRRFAGEDHEAILYRPAKRPASRAVVLVAGLSELGCYHPRLIALSRFLADKGLLVITPDIREFRNFQISAEPVDQIVFWFRQAPTLEGGEKIQKTGIAGISYSGTLTLIAAARPEIRDAVGFVVAIGPYCNLVRCTNSWFAAERGAAGAQGYPTRFYAKWIIMLAALDMVAVPKDRLFLHGLLEALLLQKTPPPADPGLTAEGMRWYRLATMQADQSDPELTMEIEKYLIPRIYARLDPEQVLGELRCPLFFIHGAYDDLIPPGESRELHRKTADSYLLIAPFLTHTHPTNNPLSFRQKARAVLDTLGFCYQFSRVIR
jgi:pimeloyl-ACP methyl ester carboxylesterase